MPYNQSQERVRQLYQMLFEMATGNLTFKLKTSEHDDGLDELARLLNKISEEMQSVVIQSGHVIPYFTYQNLLQVTVVLEKHFIINSFTADVPDVLGYNAEKLFGMNFSEMIADQSKTLWEKIKLQAAEDPNFHETHHLIFRTKSNTLLPSFCTISRLIYTNKVVLSSISTVLQDFLIKDTTSRINQISKPSDATIIQGLYEYIIKNLEEPLPSSKELSKMFGTNEFRLKDSFRSFFKTSIYHFYNEERLKKAHLEIQQTDLPIKAIALTCGFNDYTNFYKAFKKRFGYSPSDLDRNDRSSTITP